MQWRRNVCARLNSQVLVVNGRETTERRCVDWCGITKPDNFGRDNTRPCFHVLPLHGAKRIRD